MALKGVKVIEIAGLAPAPFCGLILSDFGADVIRIEKPNQEPLDSLTRGKRSATIDFKKESGRSIFQRLCSKADVLIEPFRPGVMERLNLGPKQMLETNPSLIYARLSGFGQEGLHCNKAGHDLNYLAISGVLSRLTSNHKPVPPMNFLADFGGGGLTCAMGILLALFERSKSNLGQVVDVSMVEGTRYISSYLWHTMIDENVSAFLWPKKSEREANLLDGGAPFYQCYRTKDNRWMSVACIEPKFYSNFVSQLGVDEADLAQFDLSNWDKQAQLIATIFKTKTMEEWVKIYKDKDACVEPVLTENEAIDHDKEFARNAFFDDKTPKPAPKLSRTPANPILTKPGSGEHTIEILKDLGYSEEDIIRFKKEKAIDCQVKSKL